jgi:dTDP-4-amino-4,6-dideoxygalactose transaminase
MFGGEPLFAEPLPMVRPALPPPAALLEDYRRLLETGQLTNGETVARLERAAAAYLGVEHCVAVSSCTSGLILVERCLGLRGEVIVPSFTFFATAHSLLWNSLDPVLADCEAGSWNLDPERVRRAITPATSAILGVHLFGNPAAARELEAIARRARVRLIFDAAHAFGARIEGTPIGAFGDAEVFSLSPTKPLVAAEGGLVATRHATLARDLRAARNYGHSGDYDCRLLGLNARMTELEAALALASLPLVEPHLERRERLAQLYEQYLGEEPGLDLQRIRPQDRSSRKDFSIVVDGARFGVSRHLLAAALEMENVPLRRYFDPPLHRQRLYRRYYRPRGDALETTERISRGVLSLPIYSQMSEDDVARIAGRILDIRDWVTGRDRATPGAGITAPRSGCRTATWAAG